jgi:hypothetical protein
MEIKKAREIVIEIERIRTTRKRCRTQILFCTGCELDTDFITLGAATALFEVEHDQLRPLIGHHICKEGGTEGDILICEVPVGSRTNAATVSSVRELGRLLFTDHAFAFEATSILILVAMVGAVVLARREGES